MINLWGFPCALPLTAFTVNLIAPGRAVRSFIRRLCRRTPTALLPSLSRLYYLFFKVQNF
jgi:hypothetical protein